MSHNDDWFGVAAYLIPVVVVAAGLNLLATAAVVLTAAALVLSPSLRIWLAGRWHASRSVTIRAGRRTGEGLADWSAGRWSRAQAVGREPT